MEDRKTRVGAKRHRGSGGIRPPVSRRQWATKKAPPDGDAFFVAPSDIISNLFLEDLEKIWELKKWIPDPCNPYLHYLKQEDKEEK